ncbi:histidyl-tRNA synthetase [Mesonia phycicola]|uniref:Histidine--tRNA ligase n=1 Tax=Mesonia phycicola TaxID=579105 RepID=A0A1M6DRP5_9FLAO|nr:histidine--tRNA ligase [Mesonia phycicola]SHI75853.1 histidyl-tRNA synthetase [Mesonia phycicola]
MAQKPTIPKGTRDFSPEEVNKRNYIISTIKKNFQHFGFQPIETPSFENSSTLMGKYGEEGDRLIFKILNSGGYLKNNILDNLLQEREEFRKIVFKIYKSLKSYLIENNDAVDFKETLEPSELKIINSDRKLLDNLIDFITFPLSEEDVVSRINGVITDTTFPYISSNSLTPKISEKALRYDLTVPFARYVVQHQNEVEFPFKRYQIQPVWRADRPQKGRFREFYQCDADVVGSNSLWQEVEFVQLYDTVFSALQLSGVTIKINNRKILSGFAEVIGESDKLIDFTVALDKLDKIGKEGVVKEMKEKGISEEAIQKIDPIFSLTGDFSSKINGLKDILASSEEGLKGIAELEFIQKAIEAMPLKTAKLDLDVTLARGLNYYTGAIFEISAPEGVSMGSIGGGGRYDDLTGIFGLKNMSGIGVSFGLDRIYLVLEELNLFPETVEENTKVIFINFGEAEALYAMKAVTALRNAGINAEVYPDAAKMKKQMTHANRRNIPYVVLAGSKEMEAGEFTLKHMESGEQDTLNIEKMITKLS